MKQKAKLRDDILLNLRDKNKALSCFLSSALIQLIKKLIPFITLNRILSLFFAFTGLSL